MKVADIIAVTTSPKTTDIMDAKWPVAIGYKLARKMSEIEKEAQVAVAARTKILKDYGIEQKNDGPLYVTGEAAEKIAELYEQDVDIANVQVDIKDVPSGLTPGHLLILSKFVDIVQDE